MIIPVRGREMNIYNKTAVCPKCGNSDIDTEYIMDYGQCILIRTCEKCGYEWN